MKISKAIEILSTFTKPYSACIEGDLRDAVNLGIEALKRLEWYRKHPGSVDDTLMPGEDPE